MIVMDFPNAVVNGSAFYNRIIEFEKVIQTILSGKRVPVGIIGERRIGKTSLLNVVMEAVCKENPTYVTLLVEPRGNTTVDQFSEAILRQLTRHFMCDIHNTKQYDPQGRFHIDEPDQFDLAVQRILPSDCTEKFIVCIDEFDEIVRLVTKTGETEKDRLFALLHHLIERSPLPLSFFFTITRVPELMKEEFPSPLITKSTIVELRPFQKSVSLGMINWLLKDIKILVYPEVKERIAHLSGGHPYFIKLLVTNLTCVGQNQDETIIGLSEFEKDVLPRAIEDPRARYAIENIYKTHFTPAEKSVMLYLAERGEPVGMEEFQMAGREILYAVRNLVNRHYLVEGADKYSNQIHFLDYWFRNWVEFEEELERLHVHQMAGPGIQDKMLN